ncbi:MAG: hypothetical protein V4555_21750 [Acidobacteriota bacterium]
MASRTLSFPPRPAVASAVNELPLTPQSPSPEPTAATPFLSGPTSSRPTRYRGLHLVGEAPVTALHIAPPPTDSAARARSIVAQVQWEIEQKAARQRSAAFRPQRLVSTPPTAIAEALHRETPLVVFRRVARSLGLISRR